MKVEILYNPNSTGSGKDDAQALARELKKKNISTKVRKTEYAGHAEKIASGYATTDTEIVLISASGDGGYHEVVNGVVSKHPKRTVVGVLPSGNANDHHTALGGSSFVSSIVKKKYQRIDVIKVEARVDGKPWTRYAHSYAGIGVTAYAAKRLTDERPNSVTEKWIVARSLFSFRSTKIKVDKKTRRYSSMLFGNIDRMSKVMTLSDHSSVKDGKFEVNSIRLHSKLRLILYLIGLATIGARDSRHLKKFTFHTIRKMAIQLDGEVFIIDGRTRVVVSSEKHALRCVL